MFRNILLSLLLSFVCVSAFAPASRAGSSTKLSMSRLIFKMAMMKIPLSSQSISNEVIDDKLHPFMHDSAGRRPLMGGNWKLNPRSVAAATKLTEEVSYIPSVYLSFTC